MNKFSKSDSLAKDIQDKNVLGMIEKMGATTPNPNECCKENFEKIPHTSNHIWQADIHGIPFGSCMKCGKPFSQWSEQSMAELEREYKSAEKPNPNEWPDETTGSKALANIRPTFNKPNPNEAGSYPQIQFEGCTVHVISPEELTQLLTTADEVERLREELASIEQERRNANECEECNPSNSPEDIVIAKTNGWEWNTKVPGAWFHPTKHQWTHLLHNIVVEIERDTLSARVNILEQKAKCLDWLEKRVHTKFLRLNIGHLSHDYWVYEIVGEQWVWIGHGKTLPDAITDAMSNVVREPSRTHDTQQPKT